MNSQNAAQKISGCKQNCFNVQSSVLDSFDFLVGWVLAMSDDGIDVMEPNVKVRKKPKAQNKHKRQPRYHVILWNDDDHTYDYVVSMMHNLFGHPNEMGMLIAKEVDNTGRAICLTTTKEHAELKREQIHGFGRDPYIKKCAGSMSASIEPEISQ